MSSALRDAFAAHRFRYHRAMPSLLQRLTTRTPRSVERDTVTLQLEDGRDLEVQRVRDPRAKRLKLSVDERGARLPVRGLRVPV
mgnify:CR=1 FL=1